MPVFTIETTFHLPVYRHRSITADTLEEACRLAIADEDWWDQKHDYDNSGQTYVPARGKDPMPPIKATPCLCPLHSMSPRSAGPIASRPCSLFSRNAPLPATLSSRPRLPKRKRSFGPQLVSADRMLSACGIPRESKSEEKAGDGRRLGERLPPGAGHLNPRRILHGQAQAHSHPSTSIPLDRLVPSPANVRKTNAAVSIEELAASIARRGLLQSLSVRPVLDGEGNETGDYEVQAGSRRMRALKLLVKQKRLAKDAPIPCIVKTTGIAEDDSLAENSDREGLHPLDQFRAFAALAEKDQTEEDIAAAFAVTPAVVRQRLRLASASPKLLDAYAADAINLEQLMAFCVTADHVRQEKVLDTVMQGQVGDSPYTIRRLLTETCIEATDPRARFVGIEAYLAAGGTIMRDLFETDHGGWLQNPDILMRLVSEKLAAERERILAQGWKWAEAALEMPYDAKFRLRRLKPIAEALTEEDEKDYFALSEEHDGLIEGLEDEQDTPTEVRARLDAIEAELAELDNRPPKLSPEDIARSGVLLSIGHNGQLDIEYGFLRPQDQNEGSSEADSHDDADDLDATDDHEGTSVSSATDDDEEDGAKTLPDRLVQGLTAYRTVGLRNALAQDFATAFLAVLHAMCLKLFYLFGSDSCLQIQVNDHFPAGAAGLADMEAAKAIEERHEQWAARLPREAGDLWDALASLSRQGSLASLFAHCASLAVNAVRESHQRRRAELHHADRLADALSLDMTGAGWTTTADNYLARITKAQILDAVREAKGEDTARLIEHLKKADMAKEAERLLQGTGWLPEPLRTLHPAAPPVAPDADGSEPPALPAFLTQDNTPDANAPSVAAE